MRRLRLSCAVLFGWFFVLYNVERIYEPINLASFVYVLAGAMAMPLVLLPRLNRVPLVGLTLPAIPLVVLLKYWFGYAVGGPNLPLTLTEIAVVILTIYLTYHLARDLEEHYQAAVSMLVSHLQDKSRPRDEGSRAMYREVRRARSQGRPLTILAIAPSDDCLNIALDRVTKEVQQSTVRHYLQAKLADLLTNGTKITDILSRGDDHFMLLLPETGRHKAIQLIKKLRAKAKAELGLDLAVGASVFPEDEVTFVKLIERAQSRMDRGAAADIVAQPSTVPASQPEKQPVEPMQPRRVGA